MQQERTGPVAIEDTVWSSLPLELQLACLSNLDAADFYQLERAAIFPAATLSSAMEAVASARHPHIHVPRPICAASLRFVEDVEAVENTLCTAKPDKPDEPRSFAHAVAAALGHIPRGDDSGFGLGGEAPRRAYVDRVMHQLESLVTSGLASRAPFPDAAHECALTLSALAVASVRRAPRSAFEAHAHAAASVLKLLVCHSPRNAMCIADVGGIDLLLSTAEGRRGASVQALKALRTTAWALGASCGTGGAGGTGGYGLGLCLDEDGAACVSRIHAALKRAGTSARLAAMLERASRGDWLPEPLGRAQRRTALGGGGNSSDGSSSGGEEEGELGGRGSYGSGEALTGSVQPWPQPWAQRPGRPSHAVVAWLVADTVSQLLAQPGYADLDGASALAPVLARLQAHPQLGWGAGRAMATLAAALDGALVPAAHASAGGGRVGHDTHVAACAGHPEATAQPGASAVAAHGLALRDLAPALAHAVEEAADGISSALRSDAASAADGLRRVIFSLSAAPPSAQPPGCTAGASRSGRPLESGASARRDSARRRLVRVSLALPTRADALRAIWCAGEGHGGASTAPPSVQLRAMWRAELARARVPALALELVQGTTSEHTRLLAVRALACFVAPTGEPGYEARSVARALCARPWAALWALLSTARLLARHASGAGASREVALWLLLACRLLSQSRLRHVLRFDLA